MKKCLWAGMLAVGLTMSSMSSAYYIDDPNGSYDGVDVGEVDTLLAEGSLENGYKPESETAWVNEYLTLKGIANVELGVSTGTAASYYDIVDDTSSTLFAFGTIAPVDYFTIKQGNYIALFFNNEALDWGVFDTSKFKFMDLPTTDYTISHYTTYGIPTPGSLWLFGTGLIGLIGFKSRANSNLKT